MSLPALLHFPDFSKIHAVKPARQAMQIAKLPLDALVEISCIAFIPISLN